MRKKSKLILEIYKIMTILFYNNDCKSYKNNNGVFTEHCDDLVR